MLECRETNRQPSELLAASRSETVSLPAPPLSSRAERPSYWSAPPVFWSLLRIAVLRAYKPFASAFSPSSLRGSSAGAQFQKGFHHPLHARDLERP